MIEGTSLVIEKQSVRKEVSFVVGIVAKVAFIPYIFKSKMDNPPIIHGIIYRKGLGMKRLVFILFISIFLFALTQQVFALPRFALMTGAKCASCHVNPTGGQMRTEYGIGYSTDKLPLEASRDSDFTFDSKISDNISIGGDYRSQFVYDDLSKTTTFQSMTTSIYGAVTLSKKVSFYFKQDIVNGTYDFPTNFYAGTEVFGIFRLFPKGWYIKGGTFLPDYGWKSDDHTSYVRGGDLRFLPGSNLPGAKKGMIFTPNYKDIGVEVGGYIEDLSLTAGVFNGTGNLTPIDPSKDKAFVAKLEYMGSASSVNFRVGVSGYTFKTYRLGGIHAGFATGDLVILGEMDWTRGQLAGTTLTDNINTMAAYGEVDYRAMQGIWLIGKFDMFDPLQGLGDDDSTPTINTVQRFTVGLEFFPYSFVEVRPQYRINVEKPSIQNDQALVQMHIWF